MKKTLSFLLAIALVICMLPSMSLPVLAAGYNAQTVVNIALNNVGSTSFKSGYCLNFVKQMFMQAYGFESTAPCAYEYGSKFIDSTSRDNIPLGADVFFSGGKIGDSTICSNCRNIAGHVGIYVGDGYIVHLYGTKVVKTTIDYVLNTSGYNYQYRGWGYHGNVTLGDGNISENPDDYPIPQRDIYYTSPVMRGDDVCWVQAVLRKLGYTRYCTQVDGSYGPGTRDDVRCFQYDHGLPVDCIVNSATRGLLKELWEQKKQNEVKFSENPDDYPIPQRNIYYTSPVMRGDDVCWIQAVLRKLGYTKYCTQVNGTFDIGTRDDIRCFQYDHGLTVDCSVGPATRGLLKELWEQKKQNDVKLTAISVASSPNNTTYFVGDALDTSGLTLTASYSNGTTKIITSGFTTEGFDSSTAGTKTITVNYGGKSTTFSVIIKEIVVNKHYTIAYNANGGSGTMASTDMVVGTPKNLSPNTFTKTGYTFAGWALDRNAQSPVYFDKQPVNNLAEEGIVTLYAVWTSRNSPSIRVNNIAAPLGQQVQIPVYIENTKVSALTFSVKFDSSVLNFVSESELAFGFADVNTNNASSGSLTLACLNESSGIEGKIVVLTFDVLTKNSCSTIVRICDSDAYDNKDNPIQLLETAAEISVGAGKLGDVNNDGKVNIIDARWLLQASSGSRTLDDAQKTVADVNGDGKVNIIDARWLLQIASGSRKL